MSPPLIGVTSSRATNKQGYPTFSVSEAYVSSLKDAGAFPVIIPMGLEADSLKSILTKLNGILFTGGGDVHPAIYGPQFSQLSHDVDTDRDRVELLIADHVLYTDLPFLGICRGMQVVNVAMGGSLYEDIETQFSGAINHRYYPDWPRDHLAHSVQLDSNSKLADILGGTDHQVNSLHHQAIKRPAPGLEVTAHAPDGIVEAFEVPGHPFGLAVQWHPENLQAISPMQALFHSFVKAAMG